MFIFHGDVDGGAMNAANALNASGWGRAAGEDPSAPIALLRGLRFEVYGASLPEVEVAALFAIRAIAEAYYDLNVDELCEYDENLVLRVTDAAHFANTICLGSVQGKHLHVDVRYGVLNNRIYYEIDKVEWIDETVL